MGRSSGYRARNANKAEVAELRARLGELRSNEWQKAGIIMEQITSILGHRGGPSHGRIEPRACRSCSYYGHTRQHCWRRKQREEEAVEVLRRREKEWLAMNLEEREKAKSKPKELQWFQRESQEAWFDEWGEPWVRDPVRWYMGPIMSAP